MQAALEAFFAVDGQLARAREGFEPRPMQLTLARAVGCALEDGEQLVAEAGTGTGKTLAYLVPALVWGHKVLISTATKHLQEQILEHDLPLAQRALGRPIDVALMKGRTNYLCELRAEVAMAQPGRPEPQVQLLRQVAAWRLQTQTGDRAELTAMDEREGLWRELTANADQCVGRLCPHYERCWVLQMRRRAQEADVVVVNHHLYFADAALGAGRGNQGGPRPQAMALLPACDAAIFDEAHELDDIATQHFGHQIGERRFADLAHDIGRAVGQDEALQRRLEAPLRGLPLHGQALFDALPATAGRLLLGDALAASDVGPHVEALQDHLTHLQAELADDADDDIRALARRVALLAQSISVVLGDLLGDGAQAGPDLTPQEHEGLDAPEADAGHGYAPATATATAQDAAVGGGHGDAFVRYSEGQPGHRTLAARPIDVSTLLGRLFGRLPSIFVSATLRTGDSFDHIKRRLGLPEARELQVDSPFDFAAQTMLYVADDLPEPTDPAHASASAARCAALCRASGGGAFVLCTSHRAVAAMCHALRQAGIQDVFVQGEGPKAHLVDAFRRCGNGVLVATMGFWRGVDVPGRALRLVVLDRLPFASPGDPLVQARMAQLAAQELDPFMHFQLPQAALLLRQGFGRLIRSSRDSGMVAILDRRLTTRRYGALLLDALPSSPRTGDLHEAEAYLRARAEG